ncbi:MAG: chloride channel protein [Chloroflexota bacterium]
MPENERRLARLMAPLGRSVRHMRYVGKWVVLGALIGLVAGLAAITFYAAIELATHLFQEGIAGYSPPRPAGEGHTVVTSATRRLLFPLSTALGGLLAGILVTRLAPEAEGHGTDAAIACFHQSGGQTRARASLVKLVASAITLGSGGSGGREGPTAQIGAGFGSLLGRLLGLEARDRRIAVAVGIGAGIAAIFRAPLGGAILSAELLYRRDFETDALAPGLVGSIVAYTLFAAVYGWQPVFGNQPGLAFTEPVQLFYYAVLGLAVGLVGILYIKTFYGMQKLFANLPLARILKPALGGLLVGLIGLAVPQATGVGYGWVQFLMLPNQSAVPLLVILALPFLKILTTSLSIGSGGSGGIFGPGLVIGAGVGVTGWSLLHQVLPGMPVNPAPFVVVAMMSLFGSVAHAPLAMMLMVGEMTGSYGLLAPAMITVSLASVVVGDRTIYTSQPATRADSPAHRLSYSFPLLATLRVSEALDPPSGLILPPSTPVAAARVMLQGADDLEALVVDGAGILLGLVTARTLGENEDEARPIGAMAGVAPSIDSDETLDTALSLFAQHRTQRLAVVDVDRPGRLLGILTMAGITRAYARYANAEVRRLGSVGDNTLPRELTLTAGDQAVGVAIRDLGLPPRVLIISIRRGDRTLIPSGKTVLIAGDALTLLCTPDTAAAAIAALHGHA